MFVFSFFANSPVIVTKSSSLVPVSVAANSLARLSSLKLAVEQTT